MNKETQAICNDVEQLMEDVQALLAATTDAAGDKAKEARRRLVEALDRAKDMSRHFLDRSLAGAKKVEQAVREHPCRAVAASVGIGALIVLLFGRR